jgi:cytochrome b561
MNGKPEYSADYRAHYDAHYTATAKVLHWFMALLILGLLALGFVMTEMPLSPQKLQVYSWHKWAGVTVFALLLVRVTWRIAHRAPPLPWQMGKMQQVAAHLGHIALYVLMLALPISGWLMSSAKGFQTVWFGVLPIPDLLAKDKALGESLAELHESLAWVLVLMLVFHVLASLKHHFIDKDDILTRMLPRRRRANDIADTP